LRYLLTYQGGDLPMGSLTQLITDDLGFEQDGFFLNLD